MPTNFTKSWEAQVGLNHVPAYQASGRPYATGSLEVSTPKVLEFPFVTRWVYVQNHGTGSVKIGFSQNGVTGTGTSANYFRLNGTQAGANNAQTIRLELKVSELWLHGNSDDVDVVAGLTTIPSARTSGSAGTSWSGSAGVG